MRRLLALVILAVTAACTVPLAPPSSTSSTTLRTIVWGDSLGAQVTATSIENAEQAAPFPGGVRWRVRSGADLRYWANDVLATMARGRTRVVLALSTNDLLPGGWAGAGPQHDGWTTGDEAIWSWVVAAAGRDDCIAVVMPAVAAGAEAHYPGITVELAQAVDWMRRTLAPEGVALVEWDVDLTLLMPDGIHLATWGTSVTEPVESRYQVVHDAIGAC